MAETMTVHIVDDDEAMRESLAFLLRAAGFSPVVHESGDAFLMRLPEGLDGCVLTDVRMPGIDGIEMLKRMRGADCMLPIVVMTGHGDIPLAVEAMKAGAAEFLEKPFDDERLIATLASIAEQRNAARPDVERQALEVKLATLTPRERQVFAGLSHGSTNKAMARDYEISPRTIEVYRANVMIKMGAASVSDLVRMAIKLGMLR